MALQGGAHFEQERQIGTVLGRADQEILAAGQRLQACQRQVTIQKIHAVDVNVEGDEINVVMTLTSPSCPAAGQIPAAVEQRVCESLSVEKCQVDVVWDPPWSPQRISAEGKKLLGIPDDPATSEGGS